MSYVIGALAFIIILGVIIIIHEGGHFLFAKRANILCHEFSIGMGPLIWKTKKGETVYSIRAIPIGGYVSMAGEEVEQDFLKDVNSVKLEFDENEKVKRIICDLDNEEFKDLHAYQLVQHDLLGTMEALEDELSLTVKVPGENEEETVEKTFIVNRDAMIYFNKKEEYQIAPLDRNMSSKSVGKRFMTVFAGPMMNFILAIVIYLVLGIIQGYPSTGTTKLDTVLEGAPVYTTVDGNEGLRGSELVTHINGEKLSVWDDVSKVMSKVANGEIATFNGVLEVTYVDENNNTKTEKFAPMISIYSIELLLDSSYSKNNQVVVGKYSSNNDKTKAYKAGLVEGDIITKVEISNYSKEINSVNDILEFFSSSHLEEAEIVTITYLRENEVKTASIETYSKQMLDSQDLTRTKVQLGISPEYKFDLLKTLYMPFVNTATSAIGIFKTLGLLFTDKSVNIDDFSGPVGIFQLVTSTASSGFLSLLSLTAFLSVNIGFVNLLPLPALDGGRLVFIVFEAITKKKPSPKVENIVHTIGFFLLIGLFIFISFSDVLRIFGCK